LKSRRYDRHTLTQKRSWFGDSAPPMSMGSARGIGRAAECQIRWTNVNSSDNPRVSWPPKPPDIRVRQYAIEAPHVVILGAGASIAACPGGDRCGRRIPSMRNLIDVCGLRSILDEAGVSAAPDANIEDLYSAIASDPTLAECRTRLEESIADYFDSLELPRSVTVYDQLLLSLRRKDLVATFNWDPFLVQAYYRNAYLRELPEIVFLHGNVAVGICLQDGEKGYLGRSCRRCGKSYERAPLLYPVGEKRYRDDRFIANEWSILERKLKEAFMLTIFGYSAPVSDANARELLEGAWTRNESRALSEIEIVDIRPRREIVRTWQSFITRDHYSTHRKLNETWMFRFPRRSCDSLGWAILQNDPWRERPLPRFRRLDRLRTWCVPLIEEEKAHYEKGGAFVPFGREAQSNWA